MDGDLVVITAIDLAQRRISDVNCVSTNVNGVYVSLNSLYVGGQNGIDEHGTPRTCTRPLSISRSPGKRGCAVTGMVLTNGEASSGCQRSPLRST